MYVGTIRCTRSRGQDSNGRVAQRTSDALRGLIRTIKAARRTAAVSRGTRGKRGGLVEVVGQQTPGVFCDVHLVVKCVVTKKSTACGRSKKFPDDRNILRRTPSINCPEATTRAQLYEFPADLHRSQLLQIICGFRVSLNSYEEEIVIDLRHPRTQAKIFTATVGDRTATEQTCIPTSSEETLQVNSPENIVRSRERPSPVPKLRSQISRGLLSSINPVMYLLGI